MWVVQKLRVFSIELINKYIYINIKKATLKGWLSKLNQTTTYCNTLLGDDQISPSVPVERIMSPKFDPSEYLTNE